MPHGINPEFLVEHITNRNERIMNQKISLLTGIRSLFRILRGRPQIPPTLADNPLLQTILKRRSVRSFTSQTIPEDVFAAILEAGRLAPSTVNLQSWAFAVFDAGSWQQTFGRAIPFHATRAVIVIADTYRDRQVLDAFPRSPLVEYTIAVVNASLAAMNMNIAAEALGVSSVMLSETGRSGLLDARYLKEKLELPEGAVALMTIVFGYARGAYPPMPPKLPAEQIFFEGQYRLPDRETMEDWLAQMVAGYKASHLRSSFDAQLKIYQSKIGQAEADLHEMIFQREGGGGG
jgi:nitroreductase